MTISFAKAPSDPSKPSSTFQSSSNFEERDDESKQCRKRCI